MIMSAVKSISFITIAFGLILLIQRTPAMAQDSSGQGAVLEVNQSTPVVITDPVALPNIAKESIYSGTSEPGATIIFTIKGQSGVLFQRTTLANSAGLWRVTVPPLPERPVSIDIESQVEITPARQIETVTVASAATAGGLVALQLVLERLLRLLQVAGLLGRKKTRGFVFDLTTKKPIPFAILTIENILSNQGSIPALKETVVSTVDGFFKTIALPPGKYQVKATHPNFIFPADVAKPVYATSMDFYQGETINLGGQQELDIVFIPMQPAKFNNISGRYWLNLKVLGTVLQQLAKLLSLPMAVVSIVVLILYPSLINFLVVALYLVLGLHTVLNKIGNRKLSGVILTKEEKGIPNVVIRIYRSSGGSDELVAVTLTNKAGQFHFSLPRGGYRLQITKAGLVQSGEKGLSYETIELSRNKKLEYTMAQAQGFTWNR